MQQVRRAVHLIVTEVWPISCRLSHAETAG